MSFQPGEIAEYGPVAYGWIKCRILSEARMRPGVWWNIEFIDGRHQGNGVSPDYYLRHRSPLIVLAEAAE